MSAETRHLTVFRKAREMQKNKLASARIRMRFLDDEIELCLQDNSDIALLWAIEALEEKCQLIKHAYYEVAPKANNNITDEMIEQARNFPIEQLIEFHNGKAYAFCHEDKNPSLSLWKKNNNCRCFVCGQSFSPIDIKMKRDFMPFKDAVRYLCELS